MIVRKKQNIFATTVDDMSWEQFYDEYPYLCKKYGDITHVATFSGKITEQKITYYKQGSRWVEDSTETTEVTKDEYLNTMEAVPYFKNMGGYEKLTDGYTYCGRIPLVSTSINPDKTEKIIRRYTFTK